MQLAFAKAIQFVRLEDFWKFLLVRNFLDALWIRWASHLMVERRWEQLKLGRSTSSLLESQRVSPSRNRCSSASKPSMRWFPWVVVNANLSSVIARLARQRSAWIASSINDSIGELPMQSCASMLQSARKIRLSQVLLMC